MRPTLVLDLDGTLVDTLPDLHASLNRLMAAHRLDPFAAEEVRSFIGDGAAMLVSRAMEARGRSSSPPDLQAFLADYGVHATDESRLFPGALAVLEAARAEAWRLAICTNKPVAPARLLLETLGVAPFFDAIGGGGSFPTRKPDPAHLLATIDAAGGDPAASVMVGDHHNDVAAATGAGVPVIFARWGYGAPEMAGDAATAGSFGEVLGLARTLLREPRYTSSHPRTSASGN